MTVLQKPNIVMKDCDLNDREFKIAFMKKLSELKENSERQFNALRNKIYGKKEYCTKKMETLKKNQRDLRF